MDATLEGHQQKAEATREAARRCNIRLTILRLTPPGAPPYEAREAAVHREIDATRWLDLARRGPVTAKLGSEFVQIRLAGQDAEDVGQAVRARLVEDVRVGRCHTLCRQYVNNAVAYEAKTLRRRHRREQALTDEWAASLAAPPAEDGICGLPEQQPLSALWDCPALNARERHVIRRKAQGVSQTQIAKELDLSDSVITRIWQQAREKLRTYFDCS